MLISFPLGPLAEKVGRGFRRLQSSLKPYIGPAKTIWLGAVAIAAGFYVYRQRDALADLLDQSTLTGALAAAVSLLLGKSLFTYSIKQSFGALSRPAKFSRLYTVYVLTDFAKYLPGGIWGIASRIAAYGRQVDEVRTFSRAFLLENLWLIFASLTHGCVALAAYLALAGSETYLRLPTDFVIAVCVAIGAVSLVCFYIATSAVADKTFVTFGRLLSVFTVQTGVTVFLGLSVSYLFPAQLSLLEHLLVIGVFAFARVAGYVAIFAPAGIGVREGILILMLVPALDSNQVVIAAGLSRVVTVLSETLLFLFVWAKHQRSGDTLRI